MDPRGAAHAFLTALWGDEPLGRLAVSWDGEGDFRTRTFETIDAAADFGARASGNVYVRVCSLRSDFTGAGRGEAADSWAMPALAVDLDVKPKAFPGFDAASAYLDSLPIAPSIVVGSGGGLHAWWVLEEPLLLDTPEAFAAARRLADRWRGLCRARATRVGADLDPVADLARVLRLPGTQNHKYKPPRPVLLSRTSGKRHSLATVEALLGTSVRTEADADDFRPQAEGRLTVGAELPPFIPAGARHDTLLRWTSKWRSLGYGQEEAYVLFLHLFGRCEQPPGNPFTDAEAEKLFEDVWRRWPPGPTPAERHPPAGPRKVRSFDYLEFVALDIPERKPLLTPWLLEKSLCQCFARRGVGKTHISLGIAYAVASGGSFLRWTAPEPAPVLLVDGEMAADDIQDRLRQIETASDRKPPPGHFRLIPFDLQGDGGIPSLASAEGQAAVEEHLQGIKLVILDNLSCLFALPENDNDEWKQKAAPWLMDLRRRGISVLFMHHAGQSGQARGATAKEDALDWSFKLEHPPDYEQGQPARFRVIFTKARRQADVPPFEARLEVNKAGAAIWTCHGLADLLRQQALDLLRDGMTITAVAKVIGKDKSTVSRWRRDARKAGEDVP
jgi:hypothetical protein